MTATSTHHHDHDHSAAGHGHGHVHMPGDFGPRFAIGAALNIAFVVVEAAFGIIAQSMALLADAGHNLSDVFGLLMAWGAVALARVPPSARFTYGLRSSSILVALANAILLLLAVGAIGWEAVQRFFEPRPVAGLTVMIVAGIGIVVNGATALLLASGRKDDLNIRGAYLHMVADAAVSLGVLVAGAAIMATGWHWIDPVVSLVVAAVIVAGTWSLLAESIRLSLHAVPEGTNVEQVTEYLRALPGVTEVHDLHVWAMSTTETALTCHLVMPGKHPGDAYLREIGDQLRQRFAIAHATIQFEHGDAAACPQAPDHVV